MEPVMERFVASLNEHLTPEDIVNLEACINCKRCGEACAWYLGTGDEKLHPTYKGNFVRSIYNRFLTVEGRVKGALGLTQTPTVDDLREHMGSFWNCTSCGRCTLACPAGISNRRITRLARGAYADAGLSGENPTLKSVIDNTWRVGHSFGLESARVLARYALFLEAQGIEMPVDVEGAEILFVCPSVANMKIPDYAVKVAAILNAANVSYTFSSCLVETGTEIEHIVVHHELTKKVLESWEYEATRLGVKKILSVECGCDTRTLFGDATETLGRPLKFPVIMFDSLIRDKIDSGELPVEKVATPVTLHDPCHATRLAGMGDVLRDLLTRVASNFTEMTPNREQNYCCNGGAGVLRLPENTENRRTISVLKANQIASTGAANVTTPCVICMLALEDICQTYDLAQPGERMASMLFEIVYEAMATALQKRGEFDRVRVPLELREGDEEFSYHHSASGMMMGLMHDPEALRIIDWLERDPVVQRHTKVYPETLVLLQRYREMAEAFSQAEPLLLEQTMHLGKYCAIFR